MANPQAGLPVRAVQRAFDLLARIGTPDAPHSLSELARESALPVSTVARLLATLERAGFVRRNGGGQYAPGMRLLQIGLASLRGLSIYEISGPYLRQLSERSGETANLAVRADAEHAVYLRQFVSPRTIHHASWLGRMLPIRKTAIGAALAGKVPPSGYVIRRDTLEAGVTAVAAPVQGAGGTIEAALSITGPTFRIRERDAQRFGTLVRAAAIEASRALGAPGQR